MGTHHRQPGHVQLPQHFVLLYAAKLLSLLCFSFPGPRLQVRICSQPGAMYKSTLGKQSRNSACVVYIRTGCSASGHAQETRCASSHTACSERRHTSQTTPAKRHAGPSMTGAIACHSARGTTAPAGLRRLSCSSSCVYLLPGANVVVRLKDSMLCVMKRGIFPGHGCARALLHSLFSTCYACGCGCDVCPDRNRSEAGSLYDWFNCSSCCTRRNRFRGSASPVISILMCASAP